MGLFSSLFKGSGSEPAPSKEAQAEQPEQKSSEPAFPALTDKMVLNVFLADGTPLLSGKVSAFSHTELSLERAPGQLSFPTCDEGSEAFIRGLISNTPFEIKGTVAESSRILFRLADLTVINLSEQRSNFRLPISTPVYLYYEEDERMQNPEKCMLVNISVGGACFETEYAHCSGEVLRLKVKLEEYSPRVFLGEITRVVEQSRGLFRCGFLFAQLTDREAEALTRELFNIQIGNKREHKRSSDMGNWM